MVNPSDKAKRRGKRGDEGEKDTISTSRLALKLWPVWIFVGIVFLMMISILAVGILNQRDSKQIWNWISKNSTGPGVNDDDSFDNVVDPTSPHLNTRDNGKMVTERRRLLSRWFSVEDLQKNDLDVIELRDVLMDNALGTPDVIMGLLSNPTVETLSSYVDSLCNTRLCMETTECFNLTCKHIVPILRKYNRSSPTPVDGRSDYVNRLYSPRPRYRAQTLIMALTPKDSLYDINMRCAGLVKEMCSFVTDEGMKSFCRELFPRTLSQSDSE